jgi:glycosyltransferase involved in cell wall biosynthesis
MTSLGPYNAKTIINQGRIRSLITRKLTGKRFDYLHSLKLAKRYGTYFTQQLKNANYDVILAVAASTELAFTETQLPIIYLADATFANMVDYYPFYCNLSRSSIEQGHEIQQRALNKCSTMIFPSQWAADSAINNYQIEPLKVHVFPLGANLTQESPEIKNRDSGEPIHLLFLGVEWERKGGPFALKVFQELRDMEIPARLTIAGSNPSIHDKDVDIIPFINKNENSGREKFHTLLSSADFLILPTRAECFGLVFCEASAYGILSLTFQTGGVSGAISEGNTGWLFSKDASPRQFAERIATTAKNPEKWLKQKKACQMYYKENFTWSIWSDRIGPIIEKLFAQE